jgi:hypothetical protein
VLSALGNWKAPYTKFGEWYANILGSSYILISMIGAMVWGGIALEFAIPPSTRTLLQHRLRWLRLGSRNTFMVIHYFLLISLGGPISVALFKTHLQADDIGVVFSPPQMDDVRFWIPMAFFWIFFMFILMYLPFGLLFGREVMIHFIRGISILLPFVLYIAIYDESQTYQPKWLEVLG